ncbi:hypothetical protein ACIBIZ_51075 [Nonomuraea spiralis]|uniref:hypothetical protein n=1 Tax=Nonomuraea TaxID=83681 RepID=UPI000F78EC48|nr:hypothetical protein [Nonomuraea sp. WAC 01424]RSN15682.1 hypothetical protein DMB42_02465 [Nonomuraea sp. WAC 01424]
MNLRNDDEHLDEAADRPTPPPEPVPSPGNDGRNRRPPPSDKLVYGPVIGPAIPPGASTGPSEPLLTPEPAG